METVLLVVLVGVMNLLAFLIGAKTAQKIEKGEEIEPPKINPVQIYRDYTEQKEEKAKQEEMEINMYNVDHYTGDGLGQKDFK